MDAKNASRALKRSATSEYQRAIRQGVVVRPTHCEECGKECKPEGHHADYLKPLEVVWLCRKCHSHKHPPDHSKYVYHTCYRKTSLRVNVYAVGSVVFSRFLSEKIPIDTVLNVLISVDGKTITLRKATSGCKVRAANQNGSNRLNMRKIQNTLTALGIPLPAEYKVEWDDEAQAWVGRLMEEKASCV